MNLHELVDGIEGRIRSRQAQAPVESSPQDIDRFLDRDAREFHPEVEPSSLDVGPATTERSILGRLPPSRARRTVQKVTFPSPVDSSYPANDTVVGERWHGPDAADASTAIVMLHGAFAPEFVAEGLLSVPLLRRDIHVYALAEPFHMDRAPPESEYSGQYLLSGDVPRFIDGMVQAVADVRTLVATLREQGYDRVYLSGISLGGNVVSQALTMSEVDGGFLAIPAVDMAMTMRESPIARGIRRAALDAGFDEESVAEALSVIDPLELGDPVPDPENIYVVYGTWDRQAPAEPIERLVDEWGGPTAQMYPAGHRTLALRIFALRHQMAGWLDARLADPR